MPTTDPGPGYEADNSVEAGVARLRAVNAGEDPELPRNAASSDVDRVRAAMPEPVSGADDPEIATVEASAEGDIVNGQQTTANEVGANGAFSDISSESETFSKLQDAQQQATIQQRYNQTTSGDWRVRIRLSPGATYLYQDSSNAILAPLRYSDGVIFPYTPTIQTNFNANYEKYDLVHSNYRGYFYKNSTVGDISIHGTFTAQDTFEAQYLLAVIVFFRSVTKMFYGKDEFRGAPPPLVELSGFGQYQFNNHPCLVSSFNYSLPNDVDYIRVNPNNQGINLAQRQNRASGSPFATIQSVVNRLTSSGLFGGATATPGDLGSFANQTAFGTGATTYVPTKMDIQLTLLPVQTRQQVSQQFSLKNFSNGNLLKGGFW